MNTNSRFFRASLWLHRWASLVATPFFLVLCLTGTVLIFHEEIDRALGHSPVAPALEGPQLDFDALTSAALASRPGTRINSFHWDETDHPGLVSISVAPVSQPKARDSERLWLTRIGAQAVTVPDHHDTLTGFLLELHAQWFLGFFGELFGALIALLVLLSLLSGLVVYAPYVKRIAFGVLRRGKGRGARLLQLDLHNFIGVIVTGWALVVTVTGLLLGIGTLALGLWQLTELRELTARYASDKTPVDLVRPATGPQAAVDAAAKAAPGWAPMTVFYPDTDYTTHRHYLILLGGEHGFDKRLFRIGLVDAGTGALAEVREIPWYLKAILVSQPLHFGDYGGLLLKILWTLCTWLTLFITANGAWLWWKRRQRGPLSDEGPA